MTDGGEGVKKIGKSADVVYGQPHGVITSAGQTSAKRFGQTLAGGMNFGKIGGDKLRQGD